MADPIYKNKGDINKGTSLNEIHYNMDDIKLAGCDNLISLLKPASKSIKSGLKVAICVCMYSEDKSMLKRTLSGIS